MVDAVVDDGVGVRPAEGVEVGRVADDRCTEGVSVVARKGPAEALAVSSDPLSLTVLP